MTEAQYDSKCAVCGEQINAGDEIVFDEDAEDWVHEDCSIPEDER